MSLRIENVFYPPAVLAGDQFDIEVEIQFLEYKPLNEWFVSIIDLETGGHPFVYKTKFWGAIGSFDNMFLGMKPNYYMHDRPWNLRVEVGIADPWGNIQRVEEVRYITIYNEAPPIVCDEGYYWDPALGECALIPEEGGLSLMNMALLGMGVIVLASVVFGKTKKRSGS